MSFVDCFVAAVPTANKKQYMAHIEIAAEMFKDYGALQVVEAWENNPMPFDGKRIIYGGFDVILDK